MAVRLILPLRNGKIHAPTMSTSPGCTHSTVIVILASHKPRLSDELGHDDDCHAGDQSVERSPCRKVLEREIRFSAIEDPRQNDFGESHNCEADVKPALDTPEAGGIFQVLLQKVHGMILPANPRTRRG